MSNTSVAKGLQFLSHRISASIGTTASATAASLNSTYGTSLAAPFLIKQIQVNLAMHFGTIADMHTIGFANGAATVTEIKEALEDTLIDPFDPTTLDNMGKKSIIFWETLRTFSPRYAGTGEAVQEWNETIKIGGGKGIPIHEEKGIQMFVYNPRGSAFAGGGEIDGIVVFKGAWLGS